MMKSTGVQPITYDGRHSKQSVQATHITRNSQTVGGPIIKLGKQWYIPLPSTYNCPLENFSNTHANFKALACEFPELEKQFLSLQKIKDCTIPSFKLIGVCLSTFLDGSKRICLELKWADEKKELAEEFLTSLGL